MCTGRVDLAFMLRAFSNGKDGVFIGGCWPGECHYITEGNYLALSMMHLCRKLLTLIGLDPRRLRLEWISAAEGSRYAAVMNDFSQTVKSLGPLGQGEGIDEKVLAFRLQTLQSMIPYIKLVEVERLRVRLKSVAAVEAFYDSAEFGTMFRELIADKLAICQIMALLREKPRSTGELSQLLGLSSSGISRHVNIAARQGMCRFDKSQNFIAAAYHHDGDETAARAQADVKPAEPGSAKIDQIVDKYQGKPGALIHVLMDVQSENQWLPKEILNTISQKLEVPLSRVIQIASFYKTFSLTPRGRHQIHVCNGASCHLRGSDRLLDSVQELIGIRPGEVDTDSKYSLETGSCQGCCSLGPEIIIDGRHHGRISPDQAQDLLKNYA
jgi:NADH:ubiquinone oxidoreductase subunit E/coenzyme F420-reducing hydrogenase delta subunit